MGRLTTHVLDTVNGKPAAGVRIELYAIAADGSRRALGATQTNSDGRTDSPMLQGDALQPGVYELVFHIGAHFAKLGQAPGGIPFLDQVPLRFGIGDAGAHYHVPLLATPWSYSTYRGS